MRHVWPIQYGPYLILLTPGLLLQRWPQRIYAVQHAGYAEHAGSQEVCQARRSPVGADRVAIHCAMWVLEAQPFGSTDERSATCQKIRHYLPAGLHVVGRNHAAGHSCIVVEKDKSISRQHATVNVCYATPFLRVKGTALGQIDCMGHNLWPTSASLALRSSRKLQTWVATVPWSTNRSSKVKKQT